MDSFYLETDYSPLQFDATIFHYALCHPFLPSVLVWTYFSSFYFRVISVKLQFKENPQCIKLYIQRVVYRFPIPG